MRVMIEFEEGLTVSIQKMYEIDPPSADDAIRIHRGGEKKKASRRTGEAVEVTDPRLPSIWLPGMDCGWSFVLRPPATERTRALLRARL